MGNLRNEGARPDVPSVFRRPAPWQSELPPTDRRQRGNIRPDGRQPDRALGQTAGTEVEIRPSLRPWWPRRSPARPTDLQSQWRSGVIAYFRSLEPCLVGMEACATAHYWARELAALGHTVKLMPPAYVKAYVKRNKNDAADAEAICEAVTRPSMRFVPVKNADQQSVLMLHRARNLLVRQRTMLVNALRAHMAEFGIIAPQGLRNVEPLTKIVAQEQG